MLKKTSDAVKKRIVFFMDFSSIFREKSTENRAKSVETSFVHKKIDEKARSERRFFSKKTIFCEILGSPENEPGRPPGGLRKAPEVLPGALRVRFCVDFRIDFARQKQAKTYKKC